MFISFKLDFASSWITACAMGAALVFGGCSAAEDDGDATPALDPSDPAGIAGSLVPVPLEDSEDDELATVSQPIMGGVESVNSATTYLSFEPGYGNSGICSGVAVSKFHILTAAHCIQTEGWTRAMVWRKYCNSSSCSYSAILDSNIWLYAQRHPDFTGAGDNGDDLAMLTIYHIYDDGVSLPEPSSYAMRIWLGSLGSGSQLSVWGWGANTWANTGTGFLRTTTQVVSSSYTNYFTAVVGSSSTCRGDSGGPAIVGGNKVAGLVSAGDGDPCTPTGGNNYYSRLKSKMGWIEAQMQYPFGMDFSCNRYSSGSSLYARCW